MGVRDIFSFMKGSKSNQSKHSLRVTQQKKFQKFQQQVAQQNQAAGGGGANTNSSVATNTSKNAASNSSFSTKKSLAVQYQYYKQSNFAENSKTVVAPPCDNSKVSADSAKVQPKSKLLSSSHRRVLEQEAKRRSSMASVVLKSLSILLGVFFIFVGTTKITPRISTELYKDLRKEFARYAKVIPLAQALGFKVPSKWYRRSIGALEILCGVCLTFIPSARIKQGANLVLIFMMLFATYNHWMVGDKFERIAPSLVFFFMLTCRLIVEYQIKRKERQDAEELEKLSKQLAAGAIQQNTQQNTNKTPALKESKQKTKKED